MALVANNPSVITPPNAINRYFFTWILMMHKFIGVGCTEPWNWHVLRFTSSVVNFLDLLVLITFWKNYENPLRFEWLSAVWSLEVEKILEISWNSHIFGLFQYDLLSEAVLSVWFRSLVFVMIVGSFWQPMHSFKCDISPT